MAYLVLGIESSCDETAAAIVADGRHVRSSVVASQVAIHRQYGGVVPEVAARRHVEAITPVIRQALLDAGASWTDLHAIAVTRGPGLVGALLVGLSAAKALAFARDLPLVGVNHLAGHVFAACLETDECAPGDSGGSGRHRPPEWPALALVASGSHTDLILIEAADKSAGTSALSAAPASAPASAPAAPRPGRLRRIGATRDDAAGEAFDKVARLLGLPYPGGPAIQAAASEAGAMGAAPGAAAAMGEAAPLHLPRPLLGEGFDFSFSGLKTAVAVALEQAQAAGRPFEAAVVARAFQEAVVDVLVEKTERAAAACGVRQLILAGGVAANTALRTALAERVRRRGWHLAVPPVRYCTDNAAMIAAAGWQALAAGRRDGLDLDADPRLDFADGRLAEWV